MKDITGEQYPVSSCYKSLEYLEFPIVLSGWVKCFLLISVELKISTHTTVVISLHKVYDKLNFSNNMKKKKKKKLAIGNSSIGTQCTYF